MLQHPHPLPTRRAELVARLAADSDYDLAVVGGGATGLGVALDAAARGLRVVLLESHDFAKGTSSRATKLVHGGVRYLAQGNISLVREALRERRTLLENAPHLAQPLAFVVPSYHWWEAPYYGMGLTAYDVLAGSSGLGRTRLLGAGQTRVRVPGVQPEGLCGGVEYWDGQFDDARLALALARTAARHGALLVNYCRVEGLTYSDGKISGLSCRDVLSGSVMPVRARCVVNATGVWVDALREMDDPAHRQAGGSAVRPMVAPSQGVHLVVDRSFLGGETALMVPKTADGRVLFAVPWLGKVILGTTDTPRQDLPREPLPLKDEVRFILEESAKYLEKAPTRADVRSIWVGLRPLVKPQDATDGNTKSISREHTILISRSGLVTVTGGKWTTYRAMAEDVLQRCVDASLLPSRPAGATLTLRLAGAPEGDPGTVQKGILSRPQGLHSYGTEERFVQQLPGADRALTAGLTEAMVRFAARHEYAVTVEDVLARRARILFLDAALAAKLAPEVGQILRDETGLDPKTPEFVELTTQYLQIP